MDDEPPTVLLTRLRTCPGCGAGVLVMVDDPAPASCEEHN